MDVLFELAGLLLGLGVDLGAARLTTYVRKTNRRLLGYVVWPSLLLVWAGVPAVALLLLEAQVSSAHAFLVAAVLFILGTFVYVHFAAPSGRRSRLDNLERDLARRARDKPWYRLERRQRDEVCRLARQGRMHPDPVVAAIAGQWATATLEANGSKQRVARLIAAVTPPAGEAVADQAKATAAAVSSVTSGTLASSDARRAATASPGSPGHVAPADRASDPDANADHTLDWDLGITHQKLGQVALAAGDLVAAREHHEASRAIRDRLCAIDPSNTSWQRDLGISRERLGEVARAAGDPVAAREHHEASRAIRDKLCAIDPSNDDWQRDLLVSYGMLGTLPMPPATQTKPASLPSRSDDCRAAHRE